MGTGPNQVIGLLGTLTMKAGCMYLSDLHTVPLYLIQHTLRSLQPKAFSLREWNDAVNYITQEHILFTEVEQAAEYLQHYKRK